MPARDRKDQGLAYSHWLDLTERNGHRDEEAEFDAASEAIDGSMVPEPALATEGRDAALAVGGLDAEALNAMQESLEELTRTVDRAAADAPSAAELARLQGTVERLGWAVEDLRKAVARRPRRVEFWFAVLGLATILVAAFLAQSGLAPTIYGWVLSQIMLLLN